MAGSCDLDRKDEAICTFHFVLPRRPKKKTLRSSKKFPRTRSRQNHKRPFCVLNKVLAWLCQKPHLFWGKLLHFASQHLLHLLQNKSSRYPLAAHPPARHLRKHEQRLQRPTQCPPQPPDGIAQMIAMDFWRCRVFSWCDRCAPAPEFRLRTNRPLVAETGRPH